MPPLLVLARDPLPNLERVVDRFLLEDRREGRARVLGIEVELSRHHGPMAHEGSAQVEPSIDFYAPRFQSLGDDLPQKHALGEVLRTDAKRTSLAAARSEQEEGEEERQDALHVSSFRSTPDQRRSIHPSRPSAASARTAAGSAPARISRLSTVAMPR